MDRAKRNAYQEKTEAQLEEWNARIAKLLAKADKAKADTKIEALEQVEKLRAKRDALVDEFDEFKQASEDKLEDVRERLDTAKDELGKGIERAYAAVIQS